jgi:hypothetical protein
VKSQTTFSVATEFRVRSLAAEFRVRNLAAEFRVSNLAAEFNLSGRIHGWLALPPKRHVLGHFGSTLCL